LKARIPNYDWFLNAFINLGWSNHHKVYSGEKNKQRVQIVLELIEQYLTQRYAVEGFTIEHALPDSESEVNEQIGNLIPLEERLNNNCGTLPLADKFAYYKQSNFKSARSFAERFEGKEFDPYKRTQFLSKLIYNNILELDQFDFTND